MTFGKAGRRERAGGGKRLLILCRAELKIRDIRAIHRVGTVMIIFCYYSAALLTPTRGDTVVATLSAHDAQWLVLKAHTSQTTLD